MADNYIIEHAKRNSSPSVLEVGVSDGSSALTLLKNRELFSKIKLTDRYPHYFSEEIFLGKRFYDAERKKHGVKRLFFLIDHYSQTEFDTENCARIESINCRLKDHDVAELTYFNIFTSVESPVFDIVKCSNVLNQSYFSESQILEAIKNIGSSLNQNGILVLSHNNDKYADSEAVVVLKKNGNTFSVIESLNQHELLTTLENREILSG